MRILSMVLCIFPSVVGTRYANFVAISRSLLSWTLDAYWAQKMGNLSTAQVNCGSLSSGSFPFPGNSAVAAAVAAPTGSKHGSSNASRSSIDHWLRHASSISFLPQPRPARPTLVMVWSEGTTREEITVHSKRGSPAGTAEREPPKTWRPIVLLASWALVRGVQLVFDRGVIYYGDCQ
ncbi:hypothetical protein T08_14508 [Trichinella sp. T8]|nr:hypothetical protein T08_14508 [Trichinella sp. T8]